LDGSIVRTLDRRSVSATGFFVSDWLMWIGPSNSIQQQEQNKSNREKVRQNDKREWRMKQVEEETTTKSMKR